MRVTSCELILKTRVGYKWVGPLFCELYYTLTSCKLEFEWFLWQFAKSKLWVSFYVKFNFYCVYLICCKFFGYLFLRIDILKDVLIFANFMFLRIFFLSNPSRCKQKQRRKSEMYFRHHTAPCLRIKSKQNTLKYNLMFHSFFIFKI